MSSQKQLTKLSLLRKKIEVDDLVSIIYEIDVKSNYNDVVSGLRKQLNDRKPGVYKLKKVADIYHFSVKFFNIPFEKECEMFAWPRGRTNNTVSDIVRDIPILVRTSRSKAEFWMKLIDLYGRSCFLCGVAYQYMNISSDNMVPDMVD
jgi:hypothetical protein